MSFKCLILVFLVQLIEASTNNDDPLTCGIRKPKITNYIYGGKSAHIEQWPWQVLYKLFYI